MRLCEMYVCRMCAPKINDINLKSGDWLISTAHEIHIFKIICHKYATIAFISLLCSYAWTFFFGEIHIHTAVAADAFIIINSFIIYT